MFEKWSFGGSWVVTGFSPSKCSLFALLALLPWVNVDQPVHWCLDTLHRHRIRCKDRQYGGKLPKDIDRIRSLFY